MVCYKAWKRTVIEIDHKMPIVFESEEEEESEGSEPDGESEEQGITDADLGLEPCWNKHPVLCKEHPKHPLIRERGRFYLERKEELALENMVR